MSTRKEKAMQSFLDGYNCAQCMILAFEDMLTVDVDTALQIASPFGGGMGRLREVCGSVSGMFMVLGYITGYNKPSDYEGKKILYEHVQELARRYEAANGSIICRELLGLDVKREDAAPEKRTDEYYKKRPCAEKIGSAAEILETYLEEIRGIV
jgi:C_GCAxxG_C_C family probable redox protein